MKRLTLVITILMLILVFALAGCTAMPKPYFYADDLTENATVTASTDGGNAGKLTDDKDSSWTTKQEGSYIEIDFGKDTLFNTIVLEEDTDNVKEFSIYYLNGNGEYEFLYKQDRIDKYRMCAVEDTETSKIKIVFDKFDKKVTIKNIEVYYMKNKKDDFRVNAYLNSGLTESGNTQIAEGFGKPEYDGYFKTLTDVTLIGNVGINIEGKIEYYTGEDNFHNDVKLLKQINSDLKVHVTILTGLVRGDFSGTNKAMKKLVNEKIDIVQKSLKEFVEKHDVDGIDYDWEYPQLPSEWAAYDKLLVATKQAINGRDLSVALWPYGVNLSLEAYSVIDYVNIMAYDQFDNRGDNSSIYKMGKKTIEYFLNKGFTKEQLRLGVPFYGRTADKYGIWTNFDQTYGKWGNVKENFQYTNNEGKTVTSTLFTNGYAMVRDKTALAIAMDLGGLMIFSTNCDDKATAEYSLHNAVAEVINQRIVR